MWRRRQVGDSSSIIINKHFHIRSIWTSRSKTCLLMMKVSLKSAIHMKKTRPSIRHLQTPISCWTPAWTYTMYKCSLVWVSQKRWLITIARLIIIYLKSQKKNKKRKKKNRLLPLEGKLIWTMSSSYCFRAKTSRRQRLPQRLRSLIASKLKSPNWSLREAEWQIRKMITLPPRTPTSPPSQAVGTQRTCGSTSSPQQAWVSNSRTLPVLVSETTTTRTMRWWSSSRWISKRQAQTI